MRPIDADELKALPFERLIHTDFGETAIPIEEIDNAPTVDIQSAIKRDVWELYQRHQSHLGTHVYEFGIELKELLNRYKIMERPQGECKSCRHRDPEDKKCDCGGQERQGCQFPVSDDYYCKYYEKGGAE